MTEKKRLYFRKRLEPRPWKEVEIMRSRKARADAGPGFLRALAASKRRLAAEWTRRADAAGEGPDSERRRRARELEHTADTLDREAEYTIAARLPDPRPGAPVQPNGAAPRQETTPMDLDPAEADWNA